MRCPAPRRPVRVVQVLEAVEEVAHSEMEVEQDKKEEVLVAADIVDTQMVEVEKEVLPNNNEDSVNDLSASQSEAEIA